MKRCVKILQIFVRTLLGIVIGLLLLYNGYVLLSRYVFQEGMPRIFGYSFAVVVTGSMEPQISVGDFIVNRSKDCYEIQDIITFYDEQRGEYVTHRVILAENGSYVTKGDANNAADSFSVPADAVVGEVVGVLRGFGSAVAFFQTPLGLFLLIGGGILIWAGMSFVSDRLEGRAGNSAGRESKGVVKRGKKEKTNRMPEDNRHRRGRI